MRRYIIYIAAVILLMTCRVVHSNAQFSWNGGGNTANNTQPAEPVKVSIVMERTSASEATMTISAKIIKGWHIYAPEVQGGPTPATINVEQMTGAEKKGKLQCAWAPQKRHDTAFDCEVEFFEDSARFVQKFKIGQGSASIKGFFEHGACDDMMCLPPTPTEFAFDLAPQPEQSAPAEKTTSTEKSTMPVVAPNDQTDSTHEATSPAPPQETEAAPTPQIEVAGDADNESTSLWSLLLKSMAAGLVALLTPCVWPMIPLTVSIFMKRNKSRRKAIADSTLYGLSIIAIFVTIGLVASMLFGVNALNALSTNGVLNVIFFIVLMAFGVSLATGKEIALPSSWATAMNSQASKSSGLASIFLMAASLCIVSFSCTAPVVGLLLAEVATSGIGWGSFIGMLGFSLSLAIPFAFFALFPGLLSKLPRSGSWMFTIKVVLGYAEMALSLKFLSVADMAYGLRILDRETFIALWVALSLCFAFVMWGMIRNDEYGDEKPGAARLCLGIVAFAFGTYLAPGLWGAPLNAVSAFVPPMETQDFVMGGHNSVSARTPNIEKYHDMDKARNAAIAQNKKLLVFFTGYGCVNCRKMEQKVLSDPQVTDILSEKYVMAELFVDDKRPLPETREVEVNGQMRKLRTIGDETSHTELMEYGTAAQPLFVIVDAQSGQAQKSPYGYDDSVEKFVNFLQ